MKNIYILDACSLIAAIYNENGAEIVNNLMQEAQDKKTELIMHKINLLEVYYYVCKKQGESGALRFLESIKTLPLKFETEITDNIMIKAGLYKSLYKMSLADSVGLAVTLIHNGYFVTADHHELDVVEENENINFCWIR